MNITSYLILLTLLLVAVCVIGILAVTFRTCFLNWCCKKNETETESSPETSGQRNAAFDDQEGPRTVRQRPFDTMEQPECPPTYEEAVQQELFRFRLPLAPVTIQESLAENQSAPEHESISSDAASSTATADLQLPSDSSSPSTSQRLRPPRSRTHTSGSGSSLHLSTINEEEDEWPVQVVIDCIGIQTARLLEKCETTVHLTNGNELNTNSKC